MANMSEVELCDNCGKREADCSAVYIDDNGIVQVVCVPCDDLIQRVRKEEERK